MNQTDPIPVSDLTISTCAPPGHGSWAALFLVAMPHDGDGGWDLPCWFHPAPLIQRPKFPLTAAFRHEAPCKWGFLTAPPRCGLSLEPEGRV